MRSNGYVRKGIKYLATNREADVLKIKTERNGLGLIKTLIVLLLIALQLTALILSAMYLVTFVHWFMLFSFVMTVITCVYVLSTNKNSQSKPVWIMFLLFCFSFGYIMYFISNEKIFWGSNKKKYKKILDESEKFVVQEKISCGKREFKNNCNYLMSAGNFVSFSNTSCKYFSSGTQYFDKVLEDIQNATSFIFIEFFIISEGVLLNRFLSILKQKVLEGVDVRIIYDDFGSHGTIKYRTKKAIKKAGIKLCSFNKVLPKFSVLLNYRDHRKIVVVDGKVGYTGGANLADEYVNEKRIHGYWKDAGVRLEGPAVDGLTLMFLRQWAFVSKNKSVEYGKYINLAKKSEDNDIVVPYADGLEYPNNIGKNAYTNMIANAKEKIYIMSPYFVIDDTITNLLINKALAGVDVKIILPEIADKKLVYVVSRNNVEKLISYGVKAYVMKNSFVHSKVMLTEFGAIVGSINMDLRSFYQQFENSLLLNGEKVLTDIQKDFDDTFLKSVQITPSNMKRNSFAFRLMAGVVNIISPFM